MSGSQLTKRDLSVIEGDARVSDRRLMEVLGYNRIGHVQRLIKSNYEELEDLGRIFLIIGKKSGRGRPAQTYYLNERQAMTICILAQNLPAPFHSLEDTDMKSEPTTYEAAERRIWIDLFCDLIGCVCLFGILFICLWIGAVFQ